MPFLVYTLPTRKEAERCRNKVMHCSEMWQGTISLSPCPFMIGTLPEKDLFGQRDVPWDISFSLR